MARREIVQRITEADGKAYDVTFQETSKVEVTRESEAAAAVMNVLGTYGINNPAVAAQIIAALKSRGVTL